MKHKIASVLISVFIMIVFWSNQSLSQEIIPGEYLVKYKNSQDHGFTSITSLKSLSMVRILDHNPSAQLTKIQLRPGHERDGLSNILKNPNVEYAVPNFKVHAFRSPAQASSDHTTVARAMATKATIKAVALKEQWALKKIGAEAAWGRAGNKGSRGILIAVLDSGVDYDHPDLKSSLVPGYDFKSNDADPMDETSRDNPGHGTHCAGIIGASGLIDGGVIGIAPGLSILPLRFIGDDGSGDLNDAIKAIDYAIKKGAKIISNSWGASVFREQARPLIEAVKRADDAGIIMVMAASNEGNDNDVMDLFPANADYPNTITVAVTGQNDERPRWSNYGTRSVHLGAPGLDILSTLPKNSYGELSGTSMSTPLVAGLVGLLASQDPKLTGAQARALLQITGQKAKNETACDCRIDAFSAVDTLVSHKLFITPAAGTIKVGETIQFSGTFGVAPYSYSVAYPSIGFVSSSGLFTAKSKGDAVVIVKDANGQESKSLAIHVLEKSETRPAPPKEPSYPGDCPLGDPLSCQIFCQYEPNFSWCQ